MALKFSAETEEGQTLSMWMEDGELLILITHEQGGRYAHLSKEQTQDVMRLMYQMEVGK